MNAASREGGAARINPVGGPLDLRPYTVGKLYDSLIHPAIRY